jgi:nitrate reductase NapE component
MNNRKEPDKEKIENNPYLLLGIPYGSDYNTVNKAFASKSLLYKKEDRDISILTSAVAEIDKICNKSGIEESYYVIPTNPDILSPPIPLARVFVTNNDIPVDSEFDYLMEYTPLQGTIKKIPEPIEAKKEYKSTPEPKSEKEYGFLFIPISLFTIIFIYWVVAFGFNTPMGYLGIGSCLE